MSEMEIVLEFMITDTSPIAGMTVGVVEEKYGIRIIHMHEGIAENMQRFNPPKTKKIEAGWYIKITGPYKKVSSFGVEASTLVQR
jgi:hypothetical protein